MRLKKVDRKVLNRQKWVNIVGLVLAKMQYFSVSEIQYVCLVVDCDPCKSCKYILIF